MLRSTDYYSKKQLAESAPFFDRALTAPNFGIKIREKRKKKLANNNFRKSIKMLRSTDYYSKKQLAESAPFFDRALTASRQFGFG